MKRNKLTIEDLMEKTTGSKKEMFFDSDVLEARIDFDKIDSAKILEILQDAKEEKMSIHDANCYVIYLSVPMFRNEQLRKKHEIKDSPYKIIDIIFDGDVMEITEFADKILSNYGFTADKVNKLKKR